jgi:hypothetical protein
MKQFLGSLWTFGNLSLEETRRILAKLSRKSPEARNATTCVPHSPARRPAQPPDRRRRERGLE